MTESPRARVARVYQEYADAQRELLAFESEHAEIMDELHELVRQRENARRLLEITVGETRIEAGGMKVVVMQRRTYDAAMLHEALKKHPKLRDRVVAREFKIQTKAFSAAVSTGEISAELRDTVTTEIKESVQIRHKIGPYDLS